MMSVCEYKPECTNSDYYSNGLLFLGFDIMAKYFENVLRTQPNLPIISVGSGNSVAEQELENKFGVKIICIDINPTSWEKTCKHKSRL